jgi:hypothetical protein
MSLAHVARSFMSRARLRFPEGLSFSDLKCRRAGDADNKPGFVGAVVNTTHATEDGRRGARTSQTAQRPF